MKLIACLVDLQVHKGSDGMRLITCVRIQPKAITNTTAIKMTRLELSSRAVVVNKGGTPPPTPQPKSLYGSKANVIECTTAVAC